MAKKWQGDGSFCRWIISKQYAQFDNGKIKPFLTEAQVIYMWEAWKGGADDEKREERARGNRADAV
jgi:hypothetical protein